MEGKTEACQINFFPFRFELNSIAKLDSIAILWQLQIRYRMAFRTRFKFIRRRCFFSVEQAVLRVHPWRAPFNSYFASGPNGITLRNYASMFSRNFIVLGWCAKWPTLITGLCAFKCILFPSPPRHVEPFARKDHFSDWWHYYALVQLFLLPLLSVLFHPRRGWKKKERKKMTGVAISCVLKLNDRSLSRSEKLIVSFDGSR